MKSFISLSALLAALVSAVPAAAQVAPFFAPPEATGSVVVRLHPMENVTAGAPRLVTFGVPFTRGSITAAGLATLRVLKNGAEIPAWVEALTPWRHATNPGLDGTSIRVARVQFQYAFATTYPGFEEVTIEWGLTDRTQSLPGLQDPRLGWHAVTSGSFGAADGVKEPDVYAVLPKRHLVKGVLRPMRMSPMDDSVPEAREDPAVMDATEHWPGQVELDHASKNNFYTVINEDTPSPPLDPAALCPYKTEFEPWLYDRAATMFVVYVRSGYLKPLREAVRHAEFYRTKLYPPGTTPPAAVGCFQLKSPDPGGYIGSTGTMYSYNESLAYLLWTTGDPLALAAIPSVVNCHERSGDESVRWSPSVPGWTERHNAFRLQASTVAYEVSGDAQYRDNMVRYAGDLIWHQDGADGQIPGTRVDGALYHYGRQHPDGTPDAFVASSWMTALLADAMTRVYAFTEQPAVARFVKRVGQWEKAVLTYDTDYEQYEWPDPLWYPHYMIGINGRPDPLDGEQAVEHSAEVATTIAWGGYFGRLLNEPDPSLTQRARDVYLTYSVGVNDWIRPAAPPVLTAFRVSPWRKWAWEHRLSGSLSWLIEQGGAPILVKVAVNQERFALGQTLIASVGVTNPGVQGTADLYLGALLPDGDTIVFFTDLAFNSGVGRLSSPATLRPIVSGVDLATPFVFNNPSFFTYTWKGSETPGAYLFFLAATLAGALADDSVDPGDVLALSLAPFTLGP